MMQSNRVRPAWHHAKSIIGEYSCNFNKSIARGGANRDGSSVRSGGLNGDDFGPTPRATATPEVFYLNELVSSSVKKREVKDLGLLKPPWPPGIGMDKMQTRSKWLRYFIDFAHGSSVHGLNHLVAPRRHPAERFLMLAILLGCLTCLIYISLDSWHRYRHESTSLVLDNNFRKFDISKPALTLCPYELLDEKKFPEVFERYGIKDSNASRAFLLSLSRLNYTNIRGSIDPDYDEVPASMWLELLYELRGQVKVWNEYENEFVWTSTERGLCMLFASNVADYFDVKYWLAANEKTTPNATGGAAAAARRSPASFNIRSLRVVNSISCMYHNFWIGIHHPDSVIEYSSPGKSVYRLRLNSLTLKISEVGTSSNVELLSVQQRNCKLPSDGGLTLWPVYSSVMCQIECRYSVILALCDCYPHFAKPTEGVPTCNARQLLCITDHLKEILSLSAEKLKECGCLQDCNEALYIDKEFTSFPLKEGSPSDAVMNLNINFPQVKYLHEELFSFEDFLASVGGAAGLFLGASVLSLCEIVYFATLRLFLYFLGLKKQGTKKLAP